MRTRLVYPTVLIATILTWSCSQPGTPVSPLPPQVSPPQRPVEFPPLTKPGRVFGSPVQLTQSLSAWTRGSRFVLYDDGTFALQYGSAFEYKGSYSEANADVRFTFQGNRQSPEDGAVGTLTQDTITVRYGVLMTMSDFEDAVYTLVR